MNNSFFGSQNTANEHTGERRPSAYPNPYGTVIL